MQWDINELRSEIQGIKKTSQSTSRMEKINKQLEALQDAQKSTGQTLSDMMIQVQTMSSEFQVLTGRFEESRYFSEKSSSELIESKDQLLAKMKDLEFELSELKKKTDQTLERAEQAKKEEAEKAERLKQAEEAKKIKEQEAREAKNAQQAKKTVAKKEEGGSTVKSLYMSAYKDYTEGNLADAREKFQSLLRDFPENDYTDNAHFWIGETYYKEQNFDDAILAYQELFDKNPKSDKVPGALLKQGLAFYQSGQQDVGKIILEQLIKKYPDTDPAKLAIRKIKKPAVAPKNIKK